MKRYKNLFLIMTVCGMLLSGCSNVAAGSNPNTDIPVEDTLNNEQQAEELSGDNFRDGELDLYLAYIENIQGAVRQSNRELTDEEQQNKYSLMDAYRRSGLRPENVLIMSKNSDFYIDILNDILYYPDRELTDEELLQLIDFETKVNDVLSLQVYEAAAGGMAAEDKAVTRMQAEHIGIEAAEKLFGIDAGDFEVVTSEFGIGETVWLVRIAPENIYELKAQKAEFSEYAIFIDAVTGIPYDIKRSMSDNMTNDSATVTIINEDWIDAAKKIVSEGLGESNDIISAHVYGDNGDGTSDITGNLVELHLGMEDDSSYELTLIYPDKSLKNLVFQLSREESFDL